MRKVLFTAVFFALVITALSCISVAAYSEGELCPVCGAGYLEKSTVGGNFNPGWSFFTPAPCDGGSVLLKCSSCNQTFLEELPDHHTFVEDKSKYVEPTCQSAGSRFYVCSVCGETNTEFISPNKHLYEPVVVEPKCETDGYIDYVCKLCGDSINHAVIPTNGHAYEYRNVKPTCTEEGYTADVCEICGGMRNKTTFAALGHSYPQNWTVEKEATESSEGRKVKKCSVCGYVLAETIPMLLPPPTELPATEAPQTEAPPTEQPATEAPQTEPPETIAPVSQAPQTEISDTEKPQTEAPDTTPSGSNNDSAPSGPTEDGTYASGGSTKQPSNGKKPVIWPYIAAGGGVAGAGIGYALLKRRIAKKAAEEALEAAAEGFIPEFEQRTVVTDTKNEKLIKMMRSKTFLKVFVTDSEGLSDAIEENEPDLVLQEISSTDDITDAEDVDVSVITSDKNLEDDLKALKKDKEILGYGFSDASAYSLYCRLVLPCAKPNMKSEEMLDNIGMIADALGIPLVSTVIDLYVNGRNIKDAAASEEFGFCEASTVIGAIASVLGVDVVSNAADIAVDAIDVKDNVRKDGGAGELKGGAVAVNDIISILSDM